jgi:Ca2+-binding RTX toxin-like protein
MTTPVMGAGRTGADGTSNESAGPAARNLVVVAPNHPDHRSGSAKEGISIMSNRKDVITRNAMVGFLTAAVAVATGLVVPPPAYAAVCHSATVTIDYSGATEPSTITGTSGEDVILGSQYADVIDGGGGNDTICGGPGADDIQGGNGSDMILGDGTNSGADEQNHIYGGDGNDNIHGDIGDDVISGGGGDDVLYGGTAGDDTIFANDDTAASKDYVDGEINDGGPGDTCRTNGPDTQHNCP